MTEEEKRKLVNDVVMPYLIDVEMNPQSSISLTLISKSGRITGIRKEESKQYK